MNIKKTKLLNTEEIHSSRIDKEDVKIVKDFAHLGSVISSNGDCGQEVKGRPRLWRAGMEESGKGTEGKDASIETKAKIGPTPAFSTTVCRCESWVVRENERKS